MQLTGLKFVSMWQLGYRLCLEMLKCILIKTISKENKNFHTGTNSSDFVSVCYIKIHRLSLIHMSLSDSACAYRPILINMMCVYVIPIRLRAKIRRNSGKHRSLFLFQEKAFHILRCFLPVTCTAQDILQHRHIRKKGIILKYSVLRMGNMLFM